jgi:imidazolonepropionase
MTRPRPTVPIAFTRIGTLLTMRPDLPVPRTGAALADVGARYDCYLIVDNGKIAAVADGAAPASTAGMEVVDCGGRLVTPGFVDAHTHPVFAATREAEFRMRVAGKSYEAIAAAGGGILTSARATQRASEADLEAGLRRRLDDFARQGTTFIEAKSGYGLTLASELASLRVMARASDHAVGMSPTFMGAHAVPAEYRELRADYVRLVIDERIPAVAGMRGGGAARAENCDVFCETGAFTTAESEAILLAARAAGMRPRIHADEFGPSGGTLVAGKVGAATADHLIGVDDAGIAALVAAKVQPVLLPATSFFIRKPYAPARKLVDAGLAVCIATDFNPGSSMTESMPFVLTLACLYLGLSVEEAWVAATVNPAHSRGRAAERGSIGAGKVADLVLWNATDPAAVPYHFASNQIAGVWAAGRQVVGA